MTTAATPRSLRDAPALSPRPGRTSAPPSGANGGNGSGNPAPPRAPMPTPDDSRAAREARAAEAREKDMLTFRLAGRRRTLSTLVIGLAMIIARFTDIIVIPWSAAAAIMSLGVVINEIVWRAGTTARFYRWWLRYFFATYDAMLISCAVAAYGHPAMLVIYFLAIVPYSFDHGRSLGYYTAGASAVGYLVAMVVFGATHPDRAVDWPWVIIGATLLVISAAQIVPLPAKLIRRIRDTREKIGLAEQGDLSVRTSARYRDELGLLEASINRMLSELGTTIEGVQRESVEVAAYAERVASATETLRRTGDEFATTTRGLATRLAEQRRSTE